MRSDRIWVLVHVHVCETNNFIGHIILSRKYRTNKRYKYFTEVEIHRISGREFNTVQACSLDVHVILNNFALAIETQSKITWILYNYDMENMYM